MSDNVAFYSFRSYDIAYLVFSIFFISNLTDMLSCVYLNAYCFVCDSLYVLWCILVDKTKAYLVSGERGNNSDEMEKLYNHLKEASLSPIGDRKPSTKREFRASFIKRCKNHTINDKLHLIRALNSTLKVHFVFYDLFYSLWFLYSTVLLQYSWQN